MRCQLEKDASSHRRATENTVTQDGTVHIRLTKAETVQGNRCTAYKLPTSSSMPLLLIQPNSSLKPAAHSRSSMKSLIRLGHLTTRMRCYSSTRTQTCGSFVEGGFYKGLPVPSLSKIPSCPRSHHAPVTIMLQCPSCPSANHAPVPICAQYPVPVPSPVPVPAPDPV
jgi:hypothetical protein